MSALPEPDPTKLGEDVLHGKLLDALINQELERQKAAATSDLEELKARLADEKARLDRRLAEEKEENDADLAAGQAEQDKDLELRGNYHQKIAEIAGGAIDRARDSAKFVQTAAAALMTAYAALLGLIFSASGKPLPLRGVWAAVYLGLAVALAVAYLAFLKRGKATPAYEPAASLAETEIKMTAALVEWANAGASNRRNALRASVVAFAFGIAFIPAAFIAPTGSSATATAVAPSPPVIPSAVPAAIAADASRLFRQQVDAYLNAVSAAPVPTTQASCTRPWEILNACAWATQDDVERSFLYLALLALIAVVIVPLGFAIRERA